MGDYFEPDNEELLRDFFIEAEGQLAEMERSILTLESNHHDTEAIGSLFRAAHTLKGAAATVRMQELESLTHKVEDLLDRLRTSQLELNSDIVDLLLQAVDITQQMIAARQQGKIFNQDINQLLETLIQLGQGKTAAPALTPAPPETANTLPQEKAEKGAQTQGTEFLSGPQLQLLQQLRQNCPTGEQIWQVRAHFNPDQPMKTIGQVQVFARLKQLYPALSSIPELEQLKQDQFFPQVDYYLCSALSAEQLTARTTIAEVTLKLEATPIPHESPPPSAPQQDGDAPPALSHPALGPLDANQPATSAQLAAPGAASRETGTATPSSEENTNRPGQASSVLRVDSKRVDLLLNLVSETVINKAAFNQISQQFLALQQELQQLYGLLKVNVNQLSQRISQQLEQESPSEASQNRNLRPLFNTHLQSCYQVLDPMVEKLKTVGGQFNRTASRLARNTSDMHESILSMRMVPIGQIFSRFPRLVRDLSRTLGKKINLKLAGEGTEIDKSVVEELTDPLMHCVRNSIDHGIEPVEERLKQGKPESGTITMSASNEGNMVVIEVSDDGRGIAVELIQQKAIEKGLLQPNKVISDQEAFNFIFAPGFSTAKAITNLSGRGVGLDVVRRQVEKLNGSINIWSISGKGSKFTIKLPLTLAIIQGLLVRVAREVYAIPIAAVSKSMRIRESDISQIDHCEVIKMQGEVISLLRINRLFGIPSQGNHTHFFVVVVGSNERKIGLMVDNLVGEEDVVIKPLQERYTNSPGVAGATILGDGRVALILDVSKLLDLGLEYERLSRQKRQLTQVQEQQHAR